ncbi:hypothetical protein [Xylophilus ampelinus]|uniref:hypothetical protein n=1 Tax=Xylophilus ampelinus TaxID=54067 RepID=UPI0011B39FC0|nr:hypothetical protein [Xylophilus ampelinus]MCS4511489.1 hypothetical protein [Xylophilus ampelinus]
MSSQELPLAGYLLARASVGRRVDDSDTISALRRGQQAVVAGIETLYYGRGNVASDISASEGRSYVGVQTLRDAEAFLKRSASYRPASTTGRVSQLTRNMTQLSGCWPPNFARSLKYHFPDEKASEAALDFITKTVAASMSAAGNCGEHARVVANARLGLSESPESLRIARMNGVDHAWAEALSSRTELRDDDIMMDAWMRTPAHLREDSHCGSASTETRAEFARGSARSWMRDVISHLSARLKEIDTLSALTVPGEALSWSNFTRTGAVGAERAVPLNLKPEFMSEASLRASSQSLAASIEAAGIARSFGLPVHSATRQSLIESVQQSRTALLTREAPSGPEWATQRSETQRGI